jgi:hypothetical protein
MERFMNSSAASFGSPIAFGAGGEAARPIAGLLS